MVFNFVSTSKFQKQNKILPLKTLLLSLPPSTVTSLRSMSIMLKVICRNAQSFLTETISSMVPTPQARDNNRCTAHIFKSKCYPKRSTLKWLKTKSTLFLDYSSDQYHKKKKKKKGFLPYLPIHGLFCATSFLFLGEINKPKTSRSPCFLIVHNPH